MTALCDICQRPIPSNEVPQWERLHRGHCTCDCRDRFTHGLKREIVRLKALVRKAHREGWFDADDDRSGDEAWEASEVKKELEKQP